MSMGTEKGIAMVQVLVMAVILLTLATGVVKVIFGTHVMVAKGGCDTEAKGAVEQCLALVNRALNGARCNNGNQIRVICGNIQVCGRNADFAGSGCVPATGAINIRLRY